MHIANSSKNGNATIAEEMAVSLLFLTQMNLDFTLLGYTLQIIFVQQLDSTEGQDDKTTENQIQYVDSKGSWQANK